MKDNININSINSVKGEVVIPGSKSISNRVLLLSSFSMGKIILHNIPKCDDVNYMIISLKSLGIKINKIKNKLNSYEIEGFNINLLNNKKIELFIGNAGTVIRPLLSMLSLVKSNIKLIGDDRMKERPINHLVDALRSGGAKIKYIIKDKYPPVELFGGYIGGNITLNGNISSQFLSSILMMAPLAKKNTSIIIEDNLVSKPYIDITLNIMKKFGIKIYNNNYKFFYIEGNRKYISPKEIYIEGDASSASYFLAAGAIKNGPVKVIGINKNSIQGDIKFANILENMGANIIWGDNFIESSSNKLFSIDIDANDIPDVAMTIAIVSLFVNNKNKSIIRNIYNWRVKESDRLNAMSNELKKIGAEIIEGKDYISIIPPIKFKSAYINTYNDHRIAMCFSLIPLSGVNITINNYKCVNKTFPDYFDTFKKIII
ncbi:3-phosphoshikimate 1-carboxyvinyltransferase [endosymbiont of Pachyrhynchus infernalis]|uniref:3-phosphoshikimate 1-carboxyvinyltransferase n=1 Tax=endosymbiont of Pachyrhynchus infernalis TaxID=1971488 RepID=UPI000DC71544|nr:3-phosphoshikimate 1-carboxyvinyltransferase [endosymbiont of Pachyrhynchus infernalis]BBA84758.1 3-phosphoshikimate 1-carboxyvinyltransferase [endosymbiont of Pachyrhynchus infernalis]